jgi:hypothetical protein
MIDPKLIEELKERKLELLNEVKMLRKEEKIRGNNTEESFYLECTLLKNYINCID